MDNGKKTPGTTEEVQTALVLITVLSVYPEIKERVYFIFRMTVLSPLYHKKGQSGLTKHGKHGVKNENNSKNYGGV
jgi:hypothetical protein